MGLQKLLLLLLLLLLLVLLLLLLCLVAAAIAAGVTAAVVAVVFSIPTQMTHALDVSKRQQSLKDSSRAALEFPSLQCFVARQTIPSSPLTLVRLLKFSAQVVIVYPYMVYVCLLYYIHAWSN